MLSDSYDRLFGGINAIIAEKYAKMKEGTSVSDTDQEALGDKEQLDEIGCKKKMEESQDYHTFMQKDKWDDRIKSLNLSPSKNGKDHIEAKDHEGKVQGWWNGHTGIGYLHKDCETALHETNDPKNIEESVDPGFDLGYKRTHLPSGRVYYGKFNRTHHWMYEEPNRYPPSTMETISHNAVSAWNGQQPDTWKYEIQPEISKHLSLNENLETAQEVESSIEPIKQEPLKYDVSYQTPEGEMKVDTVEGQNPHELMLHYKNLEATSGIKLVDIVHNGESVMGKIPLPAPDEMHLQHDKLEKPLVQESHMTPELKDKQEHYVMKLKKNEDSFKDKYGDRWEEVMYATATKLAKNDLGIKEETVQESEVDPLEKNCNGDSIVADQPIKN